VVIASGSPSNFEVQNQPRPWLVPVLTLVTFVSVLNAVALGPFLPAFSSDLNVSIAVLGQIPALSMLFAALFGLLAGPIADRMGHRRALIGGLALGAVSCVAIGLATGYAVLMLAALVGAAGRSVAQPLSVVIASAVFEGDRQRRAMSWVMAGTSGSVIAGVPVMTTIAQFFGWRAAFFVLGMLTFLMLLAALRSVSPDQVRPGTESLSLGSMVESYRPLMGHRPTLALFGVTLTGGISVWLMATYAGAYYSARFDFTIQQIGWVYLVPGAMLVVGSLAAGGRIGALPLRPLLAVVRILSGLAVAVMFILPVSVLASLLMLLVQGFTTGVGAVAVALLLTRESPAGRATTLTLNVAAISLGTAAGSALGGALLAVGGFWLLGTASLMFGCLSAVLAVAVRDAPEQEVAAVVGS
jgi:MFS transporter, DHA1 family, inner membrane transport protein